MVANVNASHQTSQNQLPKPGYLALDSVARCLFEFPHHVRDQDFAYTLVCFGESLTHSRTALLWRRDEIEKITVSLDQSITKRRKRGAEIRIKGQRRRKQVLEVVASGIDG